MPIPRASRSLWASVLALACAGPVCSEAVGPFLAPVRLEQQQPPLKFCPGNATGAKGNASCLANEQCCVHEYYGASGCEVTTAAGTKTCCAPGPARATSTTMPNVLVIGDSVSNQYTGAVDKLMGTKALVQHAPWVGGGSANDASSGLYALTNCRWLRTAMRPDQHVNWDIIMFNFGLHDLPKTTPSLLAQYTSEVENITKILLASGAKHVVYALTTPFQADALPDCGPYCSPGRVNASAWPLDHGNVGVYPQPKNGGNGRCGPGPHHMCEAGAIGCGVPNATAQPKNATGCGPATQAVTVLNHAAAGVMQRLGVPTLDLNAVVHAHCDPQTPPGQAGYSNCTLCDDETKYMGIRCGYHYSPLGIGILAQAVADRFTAILA